MNRHQFGKIFNKYGVPQARLDRVYPGLEVTMVHFDIVGPLREAAFIAQVAHESGLFLYKEEIASGKAYEGRKDLGNLHPGDGVKFKGHGYIQVTGESNHLEFAQDFGLTIDDALAYLKTEEGAAMSAGWFWNKKGLNALADKGEFKKITKRINGGYNGLEARLAYYTRALKVLEA